MDRTSWLEWRRKGIGSSDAPAIVGTSKFTTKLALYEEKISEEPVEDEQTYITDLGNEAEPRIRNLVSLMTGMDFEPCLRESEAFPFRRWSGDGADQKGAGKIGLEIKLAGSEIYQEALKGIVSDCYKPQVHHGIDVGGLDKMIYAVYPMDAYKKNRNQALDADLLVMIDVFPDLEYESFLLQEELMFWDCVTKKKPPIASDLDYKTLKGQSKLLNKWKKAKAKADKAEAELAEIREQLVAIAKEQGHNRYLSSGVRMREESRKGSVDYGKIPAIKAMSDEDLDAFRKKGSISWKIEMVET